MTTKKALIMVDLQNDFCTNGSLAVPEGETVVPLANQLQDHFDLVIATQDWHPSNHTSFASNHPQKNVGEIIQLEEIEQILWPDHCVQNSKGAELHKELDKKKIDKIFHKGVDKKIDSYSAFFDNLHKRSTGLVDYLQDHHVKDIYIMGLATDYCVKFSALDAIHAGFNVYVIRDACRGIDLNPGDIQKAFAEMEQAGAKLVHSKDILKSN